MSSERRADPNATVVVEIRNVDLLALRHLVGWVAESRAPTPGFVDTARALLDVLPSVASPNNDRT